MNKKRERKRAPMEILQPGQQNEFWNAVLLLRNSNDRRWHEFSPGFQYSAEQYERNLNAGQQKAA